MRSKFNVDQSEKGKIKRTFDNIIFDSEAEMKCYRDYLLPLKEKGQIIKIITQPKFTLQPKYEKSNKKILPIYYVADFEIEFMDGHTEIWDVKGMADATAKLKRKIFDYVFPDKILRWVSYSKIDGGWVDVEIIEKGRKERKKNK